MLGLPRADLGRLIAAARETVQSTASVLFIVGSAALFAWVLTIDRVPTLASEFLLGLTQESGAAAADGQRHPAGRRHGDGVDRRDPDPGADLHAGADGRGRGPDAPGRGRGAQPDDRPADAAGGHEPVHGQHHGAACRCNGSSPAPFRS